MVHSNKAHSKHNAMSQFNEGHHEKKPGDTLKSGMKYTQGEMSNPEHLKGSVDKLSGYAKKHKAEH